MIRVVDGVAEFATHVITNGEKEYFAFNEHELSRIKEEIEGVNWTVKTLTTSQSKKDKAKGKKYHSRTEAVDDIEHGKKPKADMEELEARLEVLEKQIASYLSAK